MNKRKHAAHSLYKAPATTPPLTRCLTINLPDGDEWQLLFESAFSSLMTWLNYHRSGTTRESQVAQVWRGIFADLDYGNCNVFEGVSIMPVGSVIPFAGQYVPAGWLNCDGELYLATDYPDLYAIIHPFFKYTIEGVEKFRTPDMIARSAIGRGTVSEPGRSSKSMGVSAGVESIALTTANLAAHTHVQDPHNHTQSSHNHTQTAHNHTQVAHTHVQDAHNHTQVTHTHVQTAHNHTQDSHNHTQDSHNHTQDAHTHGLANAVHTHNLAAVGGAAGASTGFYHGDFTNVPDQPSGGPNTTISINNATPTNNAFTATNNAIVATNQAQTAVNQNTIAVNVAQTAVNQDTTPTNVAQTAVNVAQTAVNIAQTATNQNTGGGTAHDNMPPYTSLWYIIKAVDDTITGTPGQDGELTMLRQNPANSCQAEQSFNGGLDWSLAFDFDLCFAAMKDSVTNIENIVENMDFEQGNITYNQITNYIQYLGDTYQGDITNIYPQGVYDSSPDDDYRDMTLCVTIDVLGIWLKQFIAQSIENGDFDSGGFNPLNFVSDAAQIVTTGAGLTAIYTWWTGVTLPIAAVVGAVAAAVAAGAGWLDSVTDFVIGGGSSDDIENYDLSEFICCLYDEMSNQTISQALFVASFETCAAPMILEGGAGEVLAKALIAIGNSSNGFLVFLDILSKTFEGVKQGYLSADCDCAAATCEAQDFALDGLGPFTLGAYSIVNSTGIRGQLSNPSNPQARAIYTLPSPELVNLVSVGWYGVKISGTENRMKVEYWLAGAMVSSWDTLHTRDNVFYLDVIENVATCDEVRVFAWGTDDDNIPGWIESIEICWQTA